MVYEKSLDQWLRKEVKARGGLCIRQHGTHGVPDQLVILPQGRVFFVELKRPIGIVSPMQKQWLQRLTRMGFAARVARSKDDLYKLFHEAEHGAA